MNLSSPPTEPGFYWLRQPADVWSPPGNVSGEWATVRVDSYHDGKLWVSWPGSAEDSPLDDIPEDAEWRRLDKPPEEKGG